MFPEIVETTHYSRIYGIYWVVCYSPHRTVRCLAENIGNPPLQIASQTERTSHRSSMSMYSAPEIDEFRP